MVVNGGFRTIKVSYIKYFHSRRALSWLPDIESNGRTEMKRSSMECCKQLVVVALLAICELKVTAKPVDGDDRITMRKLMDLDGAASYFYRVSWSSVSEDEVNEQTTSTGGQQRPASNLLFNG